MRNILTRTFSIILLLLALVGTLRPALGQEQEAQGRGLVPPDEADFDRYATIRMRGAHFDDEIPRQFTLENYLPPIAGQGKTGSCVGWSTAYYCYTVSVAVQRRLDPSMRQDPRFIFSPGFLWDKFNDGESDRGMQIFQAFDMLAEMGCATLKEYPWTGRAMKWKPSAAAKEKAAFYKARRACLLFKGAQYKDPPNPVLLRAWLAQHRAPFVMAIPILSDFPRKAVAPDVTYDTKLPANYGDNLHAVTVIGYDVDRRAFQIVNSWGEIWGDHGKLWLSESFVIRCAFQGCGELPGGPRARSLTFQIVPPAKPQPENR